MTNSCTKSNFCFFRGGRDGILYHLKQNLNWDKSKPKVTIVESDEILEKYQTRFKDSITSISGSVSKVLELHTLKLIVDLL